MLISSASNAEKVGSFTINTKGNKAQLRVEYGDTPVSLLTNDAGRVYLLVVDSVIMKIGGSQCRGGIKATLSFYASGNCGRPSIRSYGIMHLIYEALKAGKQVDVYMIQSDRVIASVKGLLGYDDMLVAAFKEMETKCLSDYHTIEGDYPLWNYQERGVSWERDIQEAHAALMAA